MKKGPSLEFFKWNASRAAREFDFSFNTVTKRLAQSGVKPDADGFYTTKQMHAALFGDINGERLRKIRAEADQVEMENAIKRGELVNVEEFGKKWDSVFIKLKQTIKSSKLTEAEQFGILSELEKVLKEC